MTDLRQDGFFGGELGPQLWGRTDVKQYAAGLALARNATITRFSGIQNRSGTLSEGPTADPSQPSRMVEFAVNATNGFMLEFNAGGTVTPWLDGTPINVAATATAWDGAVNYVVGNVVISGGLYYWCRRINILQLPLGNPTYWFALPANGQLVMPTGITGAAIFEFQCVQQNDIMICVHQSIDPIAIVYLSDTDWQITPAIAQATGATQTVAGLTATSAGGGGIIWQYVATYIDPVTGMESLASAIASTAAAPFPTSASPNNIDGSVLIAGVGIYKVYRFDQGVFGYVGVGTVGVGHWSFVDLGYIADISTQPPAAIAVFLTPNDRPACVGAYQGRLLFGNTINNPQTATVTRINGFMQFTVSTPIQDNDAIQFTLNGRTRQAIAAFVDIGKLIIHTSHGEYVANGNAFGALTPTGINVVQQGYAGSQLITPVQIGNTDLFVQTRGNIFRDLRYEVQSFAFTGKDTTTFSPQLFVADSIVQMTWQQVFDSIVWLVTRSGALLSMTYIREHDIWGWTHHDTVGGYFASVCAVHEGAEDVVYVCVDRPTIIGESITHHYWIERFANREYADFATEAVFTDSSFLYDGRNTDPTKTERLSTVTGGWTETDTLRVAMTGTAPFTADSVGNAIVIQLINPVNGAVTDQVTIAILQYISTTQVLGRADRTVPTWARLIDISAWGLAVHQFTVPTANALIGQTVTGLGDGFVIPPSVMPGNGILVTQQNFQVVSIGLPVTCQIQTLPVENAAGASIAPKQVRINEITPIFYNTIGGQYGQDSSFLYPLPWPKPTLNVPGAPQNGPLRLNLTGTWRPQGQIWIEQDQPLPLGLTGIVVTATVGS